MLNEKNLSSLMPTTRIPHAEGITLDGIKSFINRQADEHQIPISVEYDQLKVGNMLTGSVEECLVVSHPEHKKDYFNFCIRLRRQGTIGFLSVDSFGSSKNTKKLNLKGSATGFVKAGWKTAGQKASAGSSYIGMDIVGGALKGAISGIAGLGGSKKKAEEEQLWYGALQQIIADLMN